MSREAARREMKSIPPGVVTLLLSRTIKPGLEKNYERALSEHLDEIQRRPGSLGITVFRPPRGSRSWSFVLKFDSRNSLEEWQRSSSHARWKALVGPMTEKEDMSTLTGMETWFSVPGMGVVYPPARWKMAVTTWLAIYPAVLVVQLALPSSFTSLPLPLRALGLTLILVPAMTFVLMPTLSRLLRPWLYASKDRGEPVRPRVQAERPQSLG